MANGPEISPSKMSPSAGRLNSYCESGPFQPAEKVILKLNFADPFEVIAACFDIRLGFFQHRISDD